MTTIQHKKRGVCVPRPSALGPYPRPPSSRPLSHQPSASKYCKNKSIFLIQVVLIQNENIILIQDFQKAI